MSSSISWSTWPTRCSIPESVTKVQDINGDRNPSRAVDTDHHAVPGGVGISHGDADHRRRHDLPCAGDRLRDPGALAVAERSAAAGAGPTAKTRERAVFAWHRRLWPRRAVANSLWRPDLAADRRWGSRNQHRRRNGDRPGVRLLQMG